MSSIRVRPRADGTTGYVLQWREAGKQHTATFNDHTAAVRHQRILDAAGPDELRRILDAETPIHTVTLTEWCRIHIDTRTGIQDATRDRYRSYVAHDIDPVIGALPLSSVTEHSIARWVQTLATDKSGKTIRNKHAFLSGALAAAVRAGHIPQNPCAGRRLPRHDRKEMVFLTRTEFDLLLSHIPEYWRPLTIWLVATGTRFSEATALQVGDIDTEAQTARISRAWKYTGTAVRELGPPKSKKSVRTIDLAPQALAACGDLTGRALGEFVFTNQHGDPVLPQRYHNSAWRPAIKAATAPDANPRLLRKPRPHDLRHCCASWMVAGGTPLPVIKDHLGHESITTTIDTYGHLDRATSRQGAAAIGKTLS